MGTIEVVSEDVVVDWIVSYLDKWVISGSPKFFVDAYEIALSLDHADDNSGLDFGFFVTDPDRVLKLDRLTVALVQGNRQLVVFSDEVKNYFDGNLRCLFKISKPDVNKFIYVDVKEGSRGRYLRIRCSIEMDQKYRRLPNPEHPLRDAMAHLFMSEKLSDCSLVIFSFPFPCRFCENPGNCSY